MQTLVGQQVFVGLGAFKTSGQGFNRRGRRGCNATQQSEGGIPHQSGASGHSLAFGDLCQFAAVVLHGVKEIAPVTTELVSQLSFHAPGKTAAVFCLCLPLDDVPATALHEMAGQLLAQRIAS